MRHYPEDSPNAVARIVALALLADGAIDPSEVATLNRRGTLSHIGLSDEDFNAVVHALCEDLSVYAHRSAAGHLEIGREALRDVLAEVRHPVLRKHLLHAVLDIAHADGELAGGEAVLIASAAECWGVDLFEAFGVHALPQAEARIGVGTHSPATSRWAVAASC